MLLNDTLVFAAVKKKPNLFDKTYKWNNESYLNLVRIPIKNANAKDSILSYFSKEFKTPMHESNAVFTKDGKTMYFTRNNSNVEKEGRTKTKFQTFKFLKLN